MTFSTVLQLLVGLGLLNVWVMRAGISTAYRGGRAKSLRGEFAEYGMPTWAFYMIGATKISAGLLLVLGLWVPLVVKPVAAVVAVLMVAAIGMHIKVNDSVRKSLPALMMLAMCSAILVLP